MSLVPSTRNQKIVLNIAVIIAFMAMIGLCLIGLRKVWIITNEEAVKVLSVRIAISIIISWFMIFIPYLAWAVYFYTINQGRTNEEWEAIKQKNAEAEPGQEKIVPENPYKNETFGLPKGTIRGSLAITLMVGALSLFIVAIGHPTILKNNEFFHENFEFFKTAFLMMIAFYFGTKGIEALRSSSTDGRTRNGELTETGETDTEPATTKSPAVTTSSPLTTLKKTLTESFDIEAEEEEDIADSTETTSTSFQPSAFANIKIIPKNSEQEKNKELSDEDIAEAAQALQVDTAALQAVIAVESAGRGFLPDGRPKILFEGHIFWNQLKDRKDERAELAVKHPDIVYETWTKKYYKGGTAEYSRFDKASLIDAHAAKMSTSWGMFQIMGFNHNACGFNTVEEFVTKMSVNEAEQLKAFTAFCTERNLIEYLRNKDWAGFALRYNGKGYKQNQYDYKLEMKYNEFSKDHNDNLFAELVRDTENDKQTQGTLALYENNGNTKTKIFECKTLELPWLNNQRNKSCIPPAVYQVQKRYTDARGNHFHVLNVQNRSSILIHSGNYYSHTLGCILVGDTLTDVNKDNYADVIRSKATLAKLNEFLPQKFSLTISDAPGLKHKKI